MGVGLRVRSSARMRSVVNVEYVDSGVAAWLGVARGSEFGLGVRSSARKGSGVNVKYVDLGVAAWLRGERLPRSCAAGLGREAV